jgi:hypothetical protein
MIRRGILNLIVAKMIGTEGMVDGELAVVVVVVNEVEVVIGTEGGKTIDEITVTVGEVHHLVVGEVRRLVVGEVRRLVVEEVRHPAW